MRELFFLKETKSLRTLMHTEYLCPDSARSRSRGVCNRLTLTESDIDMQGDEC